MTTSLAVGPANSLVAAAAGAGLPRYVLPDQARAIINAAETTAHRLLLECLWQSGGRITEVLRLRPSDLDARIRQTGYLFSAQHHDGPISRQYAGRLIGETPAQTNEQPRCVEAA
jgi:integrase